MAESVNWREKYDLLLADYKNLATHYDSRASEIYDLRRKLGDAGFADATKSVNWREKYEALEADNKLLTENNTTICDYNSDLKRRIDYEREASGAHRLCAIVLFLVCLALVVVVAVTAKRGSGVVTSTDPAVALPEQSNTIPVSNDPAPEAEKPQDVPRAVSP